MPRLRYTGGSRYALRGGPTWEGGDVHEVDDETADRLAELDKFELVDDDSDNEADDRLDDTVPADDAMEHGVCPWCDEYEGEAVGRHASAAHPDEWAAYKEDDN